MTVQDAGANPQALSPENTVFANYYGLPAISVPCGLDANRLPIGLQIVARPWDEITALSNTVEYGAPRCLERLSFFVTLLWRRSLGE